jgi:two-component system sensor histidine kinase UhpB
MTTPLHILFLEDEEEIAALVVRYLEQAGITLVWARAGTREEFWNVIKVIPSPDIIILDHQLYCWTGFKALELLRVQMPLVPIIVITGVLNDEQAVEYLKLGVYDYLLKDRLARLPAAVMHAITTARALQNIRHVKKLTEHQILERSLLGLKVILEDKLNAIEFLLRNNSSELLQ